MSDAVLVPREPFMPTVTLSPDAAVTIAGGEVVTWKECLRRLAASPSVGDWEDISTHDGSHGSVLVWCAERRNTYAAIWRDDWDTYGEPGWFHFAVRADRIREVPTHWMRVPAPPPVSTGSRPQEAVPTQQSEAAFVADLRYEVARDRAYRDGLRAGFRLGEAGDAETYEAVLGNIVSNILAAAKELNVAVSAQPADSCSSNEGAE